MTRLLGQPVLVENRAGAAGNIGNPHLFKQAGWDPIKDFAPVAMLTRAPQDFAINPKLPVNSLQELIDYARENPGKVIKGAKFRSTD